ncbi:hypothetical protein [Lutibacter sp.]
MRLLIILIFFAFPSIIFSQDDDDTEVSFKLKEIAIIAIEPSNTDVVLNLEAPNSAGERAKIVVANNSKWINFTSALSEEDSPRNLSIKIEDGAVPSGLYLKLETSDYTGSGKGQLGTPNKLITLNKSSQVIISNIGAAYTGNGVNNGFKLTYYLEIYDYKLLDMNSSETLSISLTLTDY